MAMKILQHYVPNGAGWLLSMTQAFDPERLVAGRRPVIIVPGYGMNSFIFGYHPNGASLEGYLVDAGFEVWRVDMRTQGESVRRGGSNNLSLQDLALVDLEVAVDAALARSQTGARRIDVIGASLGGTIMFLHMALNPHHRFGSIVSMGSPVRWVKVHPFVKALFASPRLIGQVRFLGSRKLAELGLPIVAKHLPWVLSVYMNPATSDVSAARDLVRTVENPNRFINRQIAHWIRERDLNVQGVNLSESLQSMTSPLLCIVAAHDGIVPKETAAFAYEQIGSKRRELLVVGDEEIAMAHADLFISNVAHERVFRPIADFFERQADLAVA